MGIFDSIKNAIWGEAEAEKPQTEEKAAAPAKVEAPAATPAPQKPQTPTEASKPATEAPAKPTGGSVPPPAADKAAGATKAGAVDVAAILDAAVRKNGQSLNWKTSIVDLMKALGLDSSLAARKELAGELGYTGDTADSATMNQWLHAQVLRKLSENGGQVPADLL